MAKDKIAKLSLENEVKALKKHFGGFVATLKALKEAVEALQKNTPAKENDEIKEILKRQKVVEDGIASNADALSRIDREIDELSNKIKVTKDGINNQNDEKETGDKLQKQNNIKQVQRKICRYYNKGHCKYRNKYRFFHPQNICKVYLESGKCVGKECSDRHPKTCRYWSRNKTGCARNFDCDFLHVTLVHDDGKTRIEGKVDEEEFKCASCKDCWKDKRCMEEHTEQP